LEESVVSETISSIEARNLLADQMPSSYQAWRSAVQNASFSGSVQSGSLHLEIGVQAAMVDHPGQAITDEFLHFFGLRRELQNLITMFARDGFSMSGREGVRISDETARAASALITLFPNAIRLPKILPDSDGALTMVWGSETAPLLALIDGWCIHVAVRATTPDAKYYPGIPFNGSEIPSELANHLPNS
jgi:hypothetical protein